MKHRRFRVSRELIQDQKAAVEDRGEIRHITKALRLRVGDRVTLFDGEGGEYPALISGLSSDRVSFTLSPEPSLAVPESPLKIILGAALLKSSRFEWLIQKATELGVSEIIPFHSRHVIPQWEEGANKNRQSRWEKIASAAAKQCGRTRVPRVHAPRSLKETLSASFEGATRIFLWEKEEAKSLKDALENSSSVIFALVGPEGGFSDPEVIQAREAGFLPVRLGPRILRAETAGIVIISLLQFLGGDLG